MALQLLNINSELGAGTRGASLGVGALQVAAWNRSSRYFHTYPLQRIADENERLHDPITTPFAKHIVGIHSVFDRVASQVAEVTQHGDFPLVLAGDHSTAAATVAGIKKAFPGKRLGVVWVDAHADLHSPFSSPSGNVHGMPLAISLAEDNPEHQLNDVTGETAEYWNKLKGWGGISPKIAPEDLIFFGVRDTETPEDYLMEERGIRNYTVAEVRYRGLDMCIQESLEQLAACDHIYISFDVDSMDADLVSHGTGTPVSKGFDPDEAKAILAGLIASQKVVGFEMVEINPTLDERKNRMAETAFSILEEITEQITTQLA